MQSKRVIPGTREARGKGIHQRGVRRVKRFSCRADARRMGSLPLAPAALGRE